MFLEIIQLYPIDSIGVCDLVSKIIGIDCQDRVHKLSKPIGRQAPILIYLNLLHRSQKIYLFLKKKLDKFT